MLVFISPRFVISDCCLKEVNLADLLRLPIIPVMIDKTPWPPPGSLAIILSQHIYIDLAGTGGHGGCGRDADWSMKMREMIRRLRLYTNPVSGNIDMGMISKTHQEDVVEAMEAAAPVGSSAPAASIVEARVGKGPSIHYVSKRTGRVGGFKVEGEEKKYTDVFKSGGNILDQSASKR